MVKVSKKKPQKKFLYSVWLNRAQSHAAATFFPDSPAGIGSMLEQQSHEEVFSLVAGLVFLEVIKLSEGSLTLRAGEGLFPCVDSHVSLLVTGLPEGGATLFATERLLPRVSPHVAFEVARQRKVVPALRADEGPLPGVDHHVALQVAGPVKRGVALFARDRLSARVNRRVSLQLTVAGERGVAFLAGEDLLSAVDCRMALESAGLVEGRLTHAARVGPALLGRTVRQVGRAAVARGKGECPTRDAVLPVSAQARRPFAVHRTRGTQGAVRIPVPTLRLCVAGGLGLGLGGWLHLDHKSVPCRTFLSTPCVCGSFEVHTCGCGHFPSVAAGSWLKLDVQQ